MHNGRGFTPLTAAGKCVHDSFTGQLKLKNWRPWDVAEHSRDVVPILLKRIGTTLHFTNRARVGVISLERFPALSLWNVAGRSLVKSIKMGCSSQGEAMFKCRGVEDLFDTDGGEKRCSLSV